MGKFWREILSILSLLMSIISVSFLFSLSFELQNYKIG